MDDTGYKLIKHSHNKGFLTTLGNVLVKALPLVIKFLAVVGTIALIMVSGGIFVHNIEYLHHLFPKLPSFIKEIALGLLAGLVAVVVITGVKKLVALVKGNPAA
jgi:predicted DNA repair protein MutK